MSSLKPSSPHILIVGSLGMLARDLLASFARNGLHVDGLDLPDIDITQPERVLACLKATTPDLVINCAAYTAVDRAESERDKAFAVNRDGPANLADACNAFSIPIIHISTDYVFDGHATVPYLEGTPVNPLSIYGRSKWEGEEEIRTRIREHIIVRTAWLFGVHGPSFVKTMLRLAREREELRVVADQHGCPTWTKDLATALTRMATAALESGSREPWGTYHFCGNGQTNWHGFAEAIIQNAMSREPLKVTRIVPITTEEYPTPAHRPAWSVLDCRKVERVFGIVPLAWRKGLELMMEELYSH